MFGMQNRGELPGIVELELDNFYTRIRKLLLKEHNEKGEHVNVTAAGEVGITYTGPVANIRIVNGIVVEVS